MQGISESFEVAWENAAYNHWYNLQWLTMWIIAPASGLVLGWLISLRRLRPRFLGLVCVAFFGLVLELTAESITTKWMLRADAAKSAEEKQIVANRDTANHAFIPIIGAFNGGLAVTLCLGMAWVGSKASCRFGPRSKPMDVPGHAE
jgi:hypothetical protein